MTNQDLLLMVLTDARAIQAELADEPSEADFAAWMKSELASCLQQVGLTVNADAPFGGLEAVSAEPPETYAIGLVTESSGSPITELLEAQVAELARLEPDRYTARWVVGVVRTEDERAQIETYAAAPWNHAVCGMTTETGLGAIVATVMVTMPV